MELRVWVDGAQRVVCGVKLTTTCQEIVFALAHATQQAGRFTMIERWRNNERLLSPNEQPLVTLQRWGEHMHEVEFILRKTSTEHQPPHPDRTSANQLPSSHQQVPQLAQVESTNTVKHEELSRVTNDNELAKTNGQMTSPSNNMAPTSKLVHNEQQIPDNIFHQTRPYNPTRRPQTVLGSLTSSSSALNLGSNYVPNQINRLSNSFRPSLSATTLPNLTNNMTTSPSNHVLRPRYSEDNAMVAKSPCALNGELHNGYSIQSENQQFQMQPNQALAAPQAKNFPHEDLYSTINKKRTNHMPPVVPAKPKLVAPLTNPANPQHTLTSIKSSPMNYYQPNQSPMTMYAGNIRPRDPPGYLQYLETMAHRNSMPGPMPSSSYLHYNQYLQGNMYPRQIDHRQMYHQNGASPASSSASNCYPSNGQTSRTSLGQSFDINTSASNIQTVNPLIPKFVESTGVVINRGSAVNVKLHSNSQPVSSLTANMTFGDLNNSTHSNSSSVSQMGHDLLKVIEEQKRVLINQKNELDRLDNDREYLEARQNSEQAELIYRIESEIHKLEELWGENQAQIRKLETQDFESELDHLKSEQVRMELELSSQKSKLSQLENDIDDCQTKVKQLETELESLGSDESIADSEKSTDHVSIISNGDLISACPDGQSNSATDLMTSPDSRDHDSTGSDEEDCEDSGGDASDDLGAHLSESKLRNAREVPYVDKKGLISGIRSLKLDRSRSLNRSTESNNSAEMIPYKSNGSSSPKPKDPRASMNNNIFETRCLDTNGQEFKEQTANSNKYEFLMTL